jgi:hypothetical protein
MRHFKIVRRQLEWSQINPPAPEVVEVYDLYEGLRRLYPPFTIKWYIQKSGMSSDELMERLKWALTTKGKIKIKTVVGPVHE